MYSYSCSMISSLTKPCSIQSSPLIVKERWGAPRCPNGYIVKNVTKPLCFEISTSRGAPDFE